MVACQASLSMRFSRQEYWSGLLFPPPGHLHDPGIELTSLALAEVSFTTELPGKPILIYISKIYIMLKKIQIKSFLMFLIFRSGLYLCLVTSVMSNSL